jgi:uncharacterized protein (DUF433 family)
VRSTTDRIEINPDVMLGKPVIRGTRIPVELLLRKLSEGATEADLLDAYPRLAHEDIQAALAYTAVLALRPLSCSRPNEHAPNGRRKLRFAVSHFATGGIRAKNSLGDSSWCNRVVYASV